MGCIGSTNNESSSDLSFIDDYSIENACYGLCIGAAIGDSLGSYCEFNENITQQQIDIALKMPGNGGTWGDRVKSGQVTDDTELAICIAKGLCQMITENKNNNHHEFDIKYIAKQYETWYNSDPFDIGGITKKTLNAAPNVQQCQENAIKCNSDKLKKFKVSHTFTVCLSFGYIDTDKMDIPIFRWHFKS